MGGSATVVVVAITRKSSAAQIPGAFLMMVLYENQSSRRLPVGEWGRAEGRV